MVQRPVDGREGDIVPRDFVPGKQTDLQALFTRGDSGRGQRCAVDKLDLANSGYVIDGEQRIDFDIGAGFLFCFPNGARLGVFV